MDTRDFSGAPQLIDDALRIWPSDPGLLGLKAQAFHEIGTLEEAQGAIDKSIAVLPFTNLSPNPDNAYFAAGIQDEIIARLSKVADLKIISCTSMQRFKSAPDDIPAIAGQLGVANILQGSVQRTADQVRVNVQLIKGLTDTRLWADTFDRKLTDIFAVESEIDRTYRARRYDEAIAQMRKAWEIDPLLGDPCFEALVLKVIGPKAEAKQ